MHTLGRAAGEGQSWLIPSEQEPVFSALPRGTHRPRHWSWGHSRGLRGRELARARGTLGLSCWLAGSRHVRGLWQETQGSSRALAPAWVRPDPGSDPLSPGPEPATSFVSNIRTCPVSAPLSHVTSHLKSYRLCFQGPFEQII